MAYTTINKSTDYFNTKLYTGDGGTQSVTGVGFQPDWTWIKNRGSTDSHNVYDAVRGVTKYLLTNNTVAEGTTSGVTAFNSDGFSVGNNSMTNSNSNNYVSWNWKANGAGSANTAGSINSTVSVNTTSGFSIVKYTGTGSAGATVGHGLGVAPKMIIVKQLNSSNYWTVYHKSLSATSWVYLDTNEANTSNIGMWNNTEPTSSVFSIGTYTNTNQSSSTYVAYCFAEKTGYSKFGKIHGNGNNNGPFGYLGFSPSFMLYKKIGTGDWYIIDNKRPGYNDNDKRLYTNTNQAEETYDLINLYSNGFKLTNTTHTYTNDSDSEYLYMAWGQPLVGSNNVPSTAK